MDSSLIDLQKTIREFIQDLKDNVFIAPDEHADLVLMEFVFCNMSPDDLMKHVTRYVLPWTDYIERRDESFFIDNREGIFKGLREERIEYFGAAFQDGRVKEEDKNVIWQYFDTIVAIVTNYNKNK